MAMISSLPISPTIPISFKIDWIWSRDVALWVFCSLNSIFVSDWRITNSEFLSRNCSVVFFKTFSTSIRLIGLWMKKSIPCSYASPTISLFTTCEIIINCPSKRFCISCSTVAMPSSLGISKSISTNSGCVIKICGMASSPLRASPITVPNPLSSIICFNITRLARSSSTIKYLI